MCKAFLAVLAMVLALAAGAVAQDATYVGNTQCKPCHNNKEEGAQWSKWKSGDHAEAMKALASDEAKEVAAKANLSKPPTEAPECLKCHVTGADATGKTPEKIKPADGVQCESCHGPASEHIAAVKKRRGGDRTAEPTKKIVHPDPETCKKCHNEQSLTWRNDRYKLADGTTTGFDFEQAWAKIDHSNSAKEKK